LARGGDDPLEKRYLNFVYQPRREADGAISGVIVLGVDVTEGKRAEQALMQSEKLAVVGRLASSIAHEINNPLEAVTNLLYLAQQSATNPETQQYLATAETELQRVSAIASQTLRFHRQATKPRPVSPVELFDGTLPLYRHKLINSQVAVERRDRTLRTVLCFDGEMRQVLNNLIGNAIDSMHGKGGRLLLRSREGWNWKAGRRGIYLTVADTGSGMSRSTLAKAFEPFFTTKGIGGTGLGLWISQEIVNRHRGSLRGRSSQSPNRSGTAFTLFLPFNEQSDSASQNDGE
jgi:signal transduction histidine kinase